MAFDVDAQSVSFAPADRLGPHLEETIGAQPLNVIGEDAITC